MGGESRLQGSRLSDAFVMSNQRQQLFERQLNGENRMLEMINKV